MSANIKASINGKQAIIGVGGVDQSKLTPLLVAAVKELAERVEVLESK
jgi:hypothetical protein